MIKGNRVMGALNVEIKRELSIATKMMLYRKVITLAVVYGCGC